MVEIWTSAAGLAAMCAAIVHDLIAMRRQRARYETVIRLVGSAPHAVTVVEFDDCGAVQAITVGTTTCEIRNS